MIVVFICHFWRREMELELTPTILKSLLEPEDKMQHPTESEQSWHPMYRYLYAVAYDAIIDYYRRCDSQQKYILETFAQKSVLLNDETLNGPSNPRRVSCQALKCHTSLKLRSFAAYLASEQNISIGKNDCKVQGELKTSKKVNKKEDVFYPMKYNREKLYPAFLF